jgi:hypothetical protein
LKELEQLLIEQGYTAHAVYLAKSSENMDDIAP